VPMMPQRISPVVVMRPSFACRARSAGLDDR
jgi:hypothetical protein